MALGSSAPAAKGLCPTVGSETDGTIVAQGISSAVPPSQPLGGKSPS